MIIAKLLNKINISKVEELPEQIRLVGGDALISFYKSRLRNYDQFKHEYECSVIAEEPICTEEEFIIAIKNRALILNKIKELTLASNQT